MSEQLKIWLDIIGITVDLAVMGYVWLDIIGITVDLAVMGYVLTLLCFHG